MQKLTRYDEVQVQRPILCNLVYQTNRSEVNLNLLCLEGRKCVVMKLELSCTITYSLSTERQENILSSVKNNKVCFFKHCNAFSPLNLTELVQHR